MDLMFSVYLGSGITFRLLYFEEGGEERVRGGEVYESRENIYMERATEQKL